MILDIIFESFAKFFEVYLKGKSKIVLAVIGVVLLVILLVLIITIVN